MGDMFAPYCPTCESRKLINVSRIVASDWGRGGSVYVRCYCGTVLDAEAEPPERPSLTAA